jgi:uncharacterized protein YjbJ (UPF0337 family)
LRCVHSASERSVKYGLLMHARVAASTPDYPFSDSFLTAFSEVRVAPVRGATVPALLESNGRRQRKGAAMEDKIKGRMKEAAGSIAGDEDLKAEGRALQRKAAAEQDAAQRERTRRAEAKAKEAERERDEQELKDKGLLGNVGDTLPKL